MFRHDIERTALDHVARLRRQASAHRLVDERGLGGSAARRIARLLRGLAERLDGGTNKGEGLAARGVLARG